MDPAELLRAYAVAGDSGDDTTLRALLDPDVVTHSPGGRDLLGGEAQVAAWAQAREGLDELRHEVLEVVVDGATAVARTRVTGVHRGTFLGIEPTGVRVEVDLALFARIESGRIAELWEIVDTGAALRQLGVVGDDQALGPG